MTLVYQNKVFLAVVPIEDVEVIEQLENCIDGADIERMPTKRRTNQYH